MRFLLFIFVVPLFVATTLVNNASGRDVPRNSKILKVKKGQTLIEILRDHGWKSKGISKVVNNPKLKKRTVYPDEVYFLAKEGPTETLIFFTKEKDSAFFLSNGPQGPKIEYDDVNYDIKIKKVSGTVLGSLQASILKKIDSLDVPQRFMNAYLLDYNLRKDIQKGAKFELHYQKKYLGEHFVKYGEVIYTALDIRGKKVEKDFVFFESGGRAFVTRNAGKKAKKKFYAPVSYLQITSLYHPRRRHPISKRIIPHMGIDFALPTGSNIYAAGSGTIIRFGQGRATGKYVVIQHEDGYKSFYNHLSNVAPLKKGQKVNAGDKIGEIGCTGYCTRPHLHFAIKKHQRYVNPASMIYTYPYHKTQIVQAHLN